MFGRVIVVLAIAALLWAALARNTGAGPNPASHTVRPGETLWSIARDRYGGDPREGVWRIQLGNGLSGATIVPGQQLILP